MVASEVATETIWQVAIQQSKYWKSVNPKACEPVEGNHAVGGCSWTSLIGVVSQKWNPSHLIFQVK